MHQLPGYVRLTLWVAACSSNELNLDVVKLSLHPREGRFHHQPRTPGAITSNLLKMRLSIAALAAGCATAHAFTNTSPFVLFSTEKFENTVADELQANQSVLKATGDFLSSCPTKHYLLVSQPNLNIEHLNSKTAAPKLQSALSSSKVQGRMMVSEMSGVVDLQQVASSIRESCQAAGKTPSIDSMVLDAVPTAGRYEDLVENLIDSDNDVGAEEKHYEAEFKDTTHQELKRQVDSVKREKKERDTRPLFEKYQFFTPGIFMTLLSLLILFSILGVGISALGSLQVPYGAFDKEMGPAAQKKQQ
ncbi:hypothetical protein G7054_g12198 [Neopestalotiopsis clavispora]|nr:hypothetical protein G7054_g12198 [Neopestalotiopsis clavispora]